MTNQGGFWGEAGRLWASAWKAWSRSADRRGHCGRLCARGCEIGDHWPDDGQDYEENTHAKPGEKYSRGLLRYVRRYLDPVTRNWFDVITDQRNGFVVVDALPSISEAGRGLLAVPRFGSGAHGGEGPYNRRAGFKQFDHET